MYLEEQMRKVALRALIAFWVAELLSVLCGFGIVHTVTGGWPTTELWLAIAGISTAVASAVDHLVAGWTLKRAIQQAPIALASSLFTAITAADVIGHVRKIFHRSS
jgi:hypothetical protein